MNIISKFLVSITLISSVIITGSTFAKDAELSKIDPNKQLIQAVKDGETQRVKDLIAAGANETKAKSDKVGELMQTQPTNTKTVEKKYKNIVFDLGGVLLYFNPIQIYLQAFPFLNASPTMLGNAFKSEQWCNASKGLITEDQAIENLDEKFNKEKVKKFATVMYNKLTPWDEGIQLFNEIKNKGYKVYILSNITRECHKRIENYDILKKFDGAIMSYQHKCAKPEPEIYTTLLKTYNLEAKECLFIDDLKENIEAGKQCGIDGIVCKNHKNVRQQLEDLKVL